MIKTLEMVLDGLPDQQLRLIKPENSREIAESCFGALLPSDPTPDDDVANTAGNGFFGARMWWQNELSGDVWYCLTGAPAGAAIWVKIYPVSVPTPTELIDGTNTTVLESPPGTWQVNVPSIPAADVGSGYDPGDLGSGTIAPGVDVPAGNVGSGYPAADLGSGTLPSGVAVPQGNVGSGYPATEIGAGTFPSGVLLPANQLAAGTVPAGVDVPWGNISGAPAPGGLTYGTLTAAGTTQGTAALITNDLTHVDMAVNGVSDGVILPAVSNKVYWVFQVKASPFPTVKLYPPVGESFWSGTAGTNNPLNLTVGTGYMLWRFGTYSGQYWWAKVLLG